MVHNEVQEKNRRKYYYRVKSVRIGNKVKMLNLDGTKPKMQDKLNSPLLSQNHQNKDSHIPQNLKNSRMVSGFLV